MKTKLEIYVAIFKIVIKIKVLFPELSICLLKVPKTVANIDTPVKKARVIQDDYDFLNNLLIDWTDDPVVTSNLV